MSLYAVVSEFVVIECPIVLSIVSPTHQVPLMYWGAGIIATGAVASLIWLDMWAPRYNEMVGM
jgi:hypothetical protein